MIWNKKGHWLLVILLLLLWAEKEGSKAAAEDCVRNTGELVVHVSAHNFGYIERFNDVVQDLVTKETLPPNLGELINRQLRIASRDVCELRKLKKPVTTRPTPRWVGRIPRDVKERQPRQAFLGGIIATLGLLEISRSIGHLLTGEGYGERFGHYLAKIRSTEHSYNIKMHQLEDKIKKLAEIQHAGLIAQEIEALIQIEAAEWDDVRTLDQDLKGNNILREAFELAEKMFEKRNYTRPGTQQGLRKILIDKRLRNVKVEVSPHAVCKWATIKITAVTAVPSKMCYKRTGLLGKQNLTLTESNYKSCVVMGSWDTAVKLGDGSVMIPSNAWERKKTTCKEALKNQDVMFHVKDGDVFLGSKGSFEARSGCGETRTFYKETVKNTTVTPKTTCRGWISINNLGGRRDEWAASQVKVSAGQPGIRGVLVETGSWLFEAYKTEEDEEEGGEEEAVVQEEEDWDWSHVEWEKATVGTGTTLTGVTVLATLAVMVWRRRTQRAKENEKGDTYVTYDNNEDKTTIGQEMEGKEEKAAPVESLAHMNLTHMNEMLMSLEKMAASMEEMSDADVKQQETG